MPSFAAVAGLISTQLLHIADVIGSGSSCSHGRCASEPSRNADETYGRKMERILLRVAVELRLRPRPASWATGQSASAAPRAAAGGVPHQPPFSCASVHASASGDEAGNFENVAVSISSKVCHGSSSGSPSWRDTSSRTSGVARVSCSGFITGGATPSNGDHRSRLGRGFRPRFEERVIGQDQIRQDARLVEEAAEAGDERHLRQRLTQLPRRRRVKTGIRAVDQQRPAPRRCEAPSPLRSDSRNPAARGRAIVELRRERACRPAARRCRRAR